MQPLNGITVVTLEHAIAAPFATRQLSDLGARVIKIERPGVGDFARGYDTRVRGIASHFVWTNRSKESLTLDVKHPEAQAILKRIIEEEADVVVQNLAPGAAARLGLSYEVLSAAKPGIIVCDISGYGDSGPYRDKKAYDLLIQSEAGFVSVTGTEDTPSKAGPSIADIAAGMYAALGILFALYQREKSGRGQLIDVSMFDSILSWLGYFPHHFWHAGEEPARVGMRHHYVTPYGPYLAKDGEYVNLAVATAQDWKVFCRDVIERPDLLADQRFATFEGRRENRKVLEEMIEKIFLERDHGEWMDRLKKAALPYGEVRGIAQVLAHPQALARKLIREVDSPVGRVPVIGSALRMSDSPARYDRIPDLGEDTEPILKELGYDDNAIESLRRDRAI